MKNVSSQKGYFGCYFLNYLMLIAFDISNLYIRCLLLMNIFCADLKSVQCVNQSGILNDGSIIRYFCKIR